MDRAKKAGKDDFAEEIAKVRVNEALMELLRERSVEESKLTLRQVREELQRQETHAAEAGQSAKG